MLYRRYRGSDLGGVMEGEAFVNFYELMGLKPSASQDAIALRFRSLARRFHPDNSSTGNRTRFEAILRANDILRDRARRAQYHRENPQDLPPFLPEAEEPAEALSALDLAEEEAFVDGLGIDRDVSIQNNLLTMLYLQRRRNTKEPGIGNAELERLSGCPHEHLEFHIWYLREKGWIAQAEDGRFAITVDGVDRAAHIYQNEQRLITDKT